MKTLIQELKDEYYHLTEAIRIYSPRMKVKPSRDQKKMFMQWINERHTLNLIFKAYAVELMKDGKSFKHPL